MRLLFAAIAAILICGCSSPVKRTVSMPFDVTTGVVKGTYKVLETTTVGTAKVTGGVLGIADKAAESKVGKAAVGHAVTKGL